ncbi:MAG: hypothetical protein J0M07_30915, partial [Anaerolineae bacterium]|nr:hypothetical protein [Anaerolineae bacterium]
MVSSSGRWTPVGDPTEVALLTLAEKLSLKRQSIIAENPRLYSIAFDSQHKFMATFHTPLYQMEADEPLGDV